MLKDWSLINTSCKWLKTFLALEVRKIDSFIAPIFGIYVNFLNFSFLDKFTTILLALPPSPPTISSLLALNAFEADFFDDPIIFNREVNSIVISLKPKMKP